MVVHEMGCHRQRFPVWTARSQDTMAQMVFSDDNYHFCGTCHAERCLDVSHTCPYTVSYNTLTPY